jgi:hypothetical protein
MSDLSLEEEMELMEEPEPDDGDPGPEEPAAFGEAAIVEYDLGIIQEMTNSIGLLLGDGPLASADLERHARWLVKVRNIRRALADVEKDLEDATAKRMTGKTEVIDGIGVLSRHERKSRTAWDKEALRMSVLDSRLVNEATGEIVDEAPVDKILAVWNLGAPRVTALKARRLNPDDFCKTEKQPGYAVEVQGA